MKSAVTVVAAALVTVVVADLALQQVAPLPARQTELDDGLAELRRRESDVLVFGSSHTRSFRPLQEELGGDRVAIVTMESGWSISLDWVMQHRVEPLLHDRLHRVIIPVTFSDVCGTADHTNIPRNAWHAGDFAEDVLAHGITEYNRAYLTTQMNRVMAWSLLAQRGGNVIERVKARLRSAEQNAEARERQVAAVRQSHLVAHLDRCPADDEVAALDRVIEELTGRGLDVTVIMFPLVPSLVPAPDDPVIARYRGVMDELARRHPIHLLDWARLPIMADEDFQDDLDHLTPAGAAKLMAWALAHDLWFLSEVGRRV